MRAVAFFSVIWFLAIFVFIIQSYAHDAPTGWTYPMECCSNYDCRMDNRVKVVPRGYQVPSGEVVPFDDKKVRQSPDGEYHWCTGGGYNHSPTLCLFVPANGS